MSENKYVQDRLTHAEMMADIAPTPHEGPALYQDPAVYRASIDQNLAMIKEKRRAGPQAEDHIDELITRIEGFLDRDSGSRTKRGKVLAGLAATLVASGILVISNGGPGQVLKNIESFPDHIAYVYHRYVGEAPDSNPTPPAVIDQDSSASG